MMWQWQWWQGNQEEREANLTPTAAPRLTALRWHTPSRLILIIECSSSVQSVQVFKVFKYSQCSMKSVQSVQVFNAKCSSVQCKVFKVFKCSMQSVQSVQKSALTMRSNHQLSQSASYHNQPALTMSQSIFRTRLSFDYHYYVQITVWLWFQHSTSVQQQYVFTQQLVFTQQSISVHTTISAHTTIN